MELSAETFLHLIFIEINPVLCQSPGENIPIQQDDVDVIQSQQAGGEQASRTSSDDGYEVFLKSVLNQILFSSKRRLSPSE